MTKPTFTNNYPTVNSAFAGLDRKSVSYDGAGYFRWIAAGADIVSRYIQIGEVTKTEAKNLREAINGLVKAAFTQIIRRQYLDLPQDANFNRIGANEEITSLCYYDAPDEARLLPGYIKKLNKAKTKSLLIENAKTLANELLELAAIVEWSKTVTYNAADRKVEVRARKEEEQKIANQTDIVYQTVLPLKKAAEDRAEALTREQAANVKSILQENGWILDAVAPEAKDVIRNGKKDWEASRNAEIKANGKRAFFLQFCSIVTRKKDATLVEFSQENVEHCVEVARREAAAEFEAFVSKLNQKINDPVLEASLSQINGVWFDSDLTVVTQNKGTQVWNTQMILNTSKYGKLFNQFPTRLRK